MFDLLSDLHWHSARELHHTGGVRYGARLLELKRLGYQFEDREVEGENYKYYRLMSLTRGAPQAKQVKVFLNEEDARLLVEENCMTGSAEKAVRDAYGSFLTNKSKL